MALRMVGDRGEGYGQFRFGRRQGRHRIGHKQKSGRARLRARRLDERVDIVGIGQQRAVEKAARLGDIVRGQTLIEPSQTLKLEVHRVRGWSLLRPSRLGGYEFGVQLARQPRDDFVLHVEKCRLRAYRTARPKDDCRFRRR